MKNSNIVLGIIVVVLVVGGIVYWQKHMPTKVDTTPVATQSVVGCYVATLSKDVYTLDIQSENSGVISGTLAFKNFEKDSSHGSLNGTYSNDVLLGDYAFSSEGMDSVRQVMFKKTADGFVEGFGPVTSEGNTERFTDVSQVTFDQSPVFKAVPCDAVTQ